MLRKAGWCQLKVTEQITVSKLPNSSLRGRRPKGRERGKMSAQSAGGSRVGDT